MTEFVCDTCGWKQRQSLATIFSDIDITTCPMCNTDTVQSSKSDFATYGEYVIIYPGYR